MTYNRFEDLPVWQKAVELYEAIEDSWRTTSLL